MSPWTGVFPAVTTKLFESGSVDLSATGASVDRLIRNGVSGVIMLPMLGENASLPMAIKEKIVRAGKEAAAGRVPVLCGLAEATSENACNSARLYQSFGAEGLMVFPSIVYQTDDRETVAWYRAIASATDLPIMIYNNPLAYKVDVTPAILRELADLPTIQCLKEETGDTRRITDLFIEFGNRFGLFCGIDDLIVESLALGAIGWVSGMTNAWPHECVTLFKLVEARRMDEARDLYRILTPSFHLDTHVKLVQYIKLAEHLVYGAPEWSIAPRLSLVGDERAHVCSTVQAAIAALDRRSRKAV